MGSNRIHEKRFDPLFNAVRYRSLAASCGATGPMSAIEPEAASFAPINAAWRQSANGQKRALAMQKETRRSGFLMLV